MNNAYGILGVSPSDSEDVIKKAYRTKAFEVESSNISESEKQRKMAELDSAFDFIFNEKRGTGNSSSHYSYSNNVSTQFPDVRQQIKDGRLEDAATILDGIPENMRSAEWHYLKGLIHRSRGWLNEAHSCFQIAFSMDPQNAEYKEAFDSLHKKANGGYKVNNNVNSGCVDCCDCCDCTTGHSCIDCLCDLWCCDSICECFGGDLCGCC